MSTGRPPPGSIPTLTEVVSWPDPPAAPMPEPEVEAERASQVEAKPLAPPTTAVEPAGLDEAKLVQRVLEDVQKQVDLMLEVRLREALAPVLVRATDALVRDARKELTSALRDVVARSVARELSRRD